MGGSPRLKGQLLAVLPGVELLNGTCYSRLGTTVDDAREMYRDAVSRQVGLGVCAACVYHPGNIAGPGLLSLQNDLSL